MKPFFTNAVPPLALLVSLLAPLQLAYGAEDRLLPDDGNREATERPLLTATENASASHPGESGFLALISPLAGYNRNELIVHGGPRGQQLTKQTDTEPMYGLFMLMGNSRFVVNDYFFYTKPNDTEVLGNLFYLNVYGDPQATVTWNLGGGHLYHEIKPDNEDIKVQAPMLKAGPVIRIKPWGITLNPYLGYVWERIETSRADVSNDALLYGLSIDWRWRMMNLNVKYYYEDSRDGYESYNAARVRFVTGLTRHWGLTVRYDYMEQMAADNSSLMIGPVYVF